MTYFGHGYQLGQLAVTLARATYLLSVCMVLYYTVYCFTIAQSLAAIERGRNESKSSTREEMSSRRAEKADWFVLDHRRQVDAMKISEV